MSAKLHDLAGLVPLVACLGTLLALYRAQVWALLIHKPIPAYKGESVNLGSWLKIVEQVAPLVLAATPAAPIAPFVAIGIQTAEKIPGASSADKLALATTIAQAGIAATNAQAGHTEIDPTAANAALASGISAVVNVANLVHDAKAEDAAENTPAKA